MNIFEYIDSYIKQNGNKTYGGLKSNSKENCLQNMLSREEKEIYDEIQESDRQRLIRFQ